MSDPFEVVVASEVEVVVLALVVAFVGAAVVAFVVGAGVVVVGVDTVVVAFRPNLSGTTLILMSPSSQFCSLREVPIRVAPGNMTNYRAMRPKSTLEKAFLEAQPHFAHGLTLDEGLQCIYFRLLVHAKGLVVAVEGEDAVLEVSATLTCALHRVARYLDKIFLDLFVLGFFFFAGLGTDANVRRLGDGVLRIEIVNISVVLWRRQAAMTFCDQGHEQKNKGEFLHFEVL